MVVFHSHFIQDDRLQTKCSLRKYAKNMPGHSFFRLNSNQERVDLAQLKHIDIWFKHSNPRSGNIRPVIQLLNFEGKTTGNIELWHYGSHLISTPHHLINKRVKRATTGQIHLILTNCLLLVVNPLYSSFLYTAIIYNIYHHKMVITINPTTITIDDAKSPFVLLKSQLFFNPFFWCSKMNQNCTGWLIPMTSPLLMVDPTSDIKPTRFALSSRAAGSTSHLASDTPKKQALYTLWFMPLRLWGLKDGA